MQKTEQLWISLKQTFVSPATIKSNTPAPIEQSSLHLLNHEQNPTPTPTYNFEPAASPIEQSLRERLQNRFFSLYIGGRCLSPYSHPRKLLLYPHASTNDVSTLAIDTLCIGVLESHQSNHNLPTTAATLYRHASNALFRRINMSMGKSLNADETDDILTAIWALAECTYLQRIGIDSEDVQQYCNLLVNIALCHGMSSLTLPMQRQWSRQLFDAAIIARNETTSSSIAATLDESQGSFFESYALQAVKLLGNANKVSRANSSSIARSHLLQLLKNLSQLIASVKRLQLQWTAATPFPFRMVDIKTSQNLDLFHHEELTPFSLAYHFDHPQDEAEFQASIICILHISQSIVDLYRLCPDLESDDIYKLRLDVAQNDAKNAADDICMLIPGLLQPDTGVSSMISATILLHFASNFYRRCDYEQKRQWCATVEHAIQSKHGLCIKISKTE